MTIVSKRADSEAWSRAVKDAPPLVQALLATARMHKDLTVELTEVRILKRDKRTWGSWAISGPVMRKVHTGNKWGQVRVAEHVVVVSVNSDGQVLLCSAWTPKQLPKGIAIRPSITKRSRFETDADGQQWRTTEVQVNENTWPMILDHLTGKAHGTVQE